VLQSEGTTVFQTGLKQASSITTPHQSSIYDQPSEPAIEEDLLSKTNILERDSVAKIRMIDQGKNFAVA